MWRDKPSATSLFGWLNSHKSYWFGSDWYPSGFCIAVRGLKCAPFVLCLLNIQFSCHSSSETFIVPHFLFALHKIASGFVCWVFTPSESYFQVINSLVEVVTGLARVWKIRDDNKNCGRVIKMGRKEIKLPLCQKNIFLRYCFPVMSKVLLLCCILG